MSKRARLYANVILLVMLFMLSVLSLLLYINYYPRIAVHLISDDELYDSIDVKKGGIVPVLPKPAKTGATFSGWYYDKDFTEPYDYDQYLDKDVELYAKYDLIDYTLTFYVEDSKDCYEPIILNYGDLTKLPSGNEEIYLNEKLISLDDYKEGYVFDGWSTSPSTKRAEYEKGSYFEMLPSNVDLYAIWKPETFNVIYRTQGLENNDYDNEDLYLDENNNWVLSYTNTNVSEHGTVGYEYSSKIFAPTNPIDLNGNFIFGGWYLDEEFTKGINYTQTYMGINEFAHSTLVSMYEESEYIRQDGNIVLFAKWYAVAYEIDFHLNLPSGSFASGIDSSIVTIKDGVQTLKSISNVYNRMPLVNLYKGDVFEDKILYTSSGKVSHAFNSWNTSPDGTGSTYTSGALFNKGDIKEGKLTLYATWSEYYYINYLMNSSQNLYSQKILLGQTIKLPHISEFDAYKPTFGYTFSKWMDTQVYDESRTRIYEINKTYQATINSVDDNALIMRASSKSINLYAVNEYNIYTIDYDLSLWTTSDGIIYDQLVENHDGNGISFINEDGFEDNEKLSLNLGKTYSYTFGNSTATNQHVVLNGSNGSMSYVKYVYNGTTYLLDKWLLLDANNEVVATVGGGTRITFTSSNIYIENAINLLNGGKPTKNYVIKLAALWVREVTVTFAVPEGEQFNGTAPAPSKFMSGKYVEFHKLSDVNITRNFHQFMGWGFDGQKYDTANPDKQFHLHNGILYVDAEHTIETTFAPYGGTVVAGGILYDDVTVYPVWKPIVYTLNIFNSDVDGNQASQICTLYVSVNAGSIQQQPIFKQVKLGCPIVAGEEGNEVYKNFSRLQEGGYELLGWNTLDGKFITLDEVLFITFKVDGQYLFNPIPTTEEEKSLALTAYYGIKTFDITISTDVEGVINGTSSTTQDVPYGTTLKSLLQPITYQLDTANGYIFKSWHVVMGDEEYDITNVNSISDSMIIKDGAMITLVVEVQKYSTIITFINPNTHVKVNEYKLDIPHGTTVSQFLATNDVDFELPENYEGFTFEGFTDKAGQLYTILQLNSYTVRSANTFVSAYSPKDVVVVYTNTADNKTSQDTTKKYGEDVAFATETSLSFVNDGYRLTGWSLTNGGEKFASVGDVYTLSNVADKNLVYNEIDGKFYLTVYSIWEQLVSLSFEIPTEVTPSATLTSSQFIKGETISIGQVLPDALTFTNFGYNFTGKWILNGDKTNTVSSKTTFVINTDTVATPEFSPVNIKIVYTYTYSVNPNTKYTLTSEEFAFGSKSEITLPSTFDSRILSHGGRSYVASHWIYNDSTFDLGHKFAIDAEAIKNNDGELVFNFNAMFEQEIAIIYNHNYTDAPENKILNIIVNRNYIIGDYNERGTSDLYEPARYGFTFTGWNTSQAGNGTVYNTGDEFSTIERNDLVLYAMWEQKQITYTLNPNCENITPISTNVNFGEVVTLSKPNTFVRDGYRMIGWSSTSTGTVGFNISETFKIETEDAVEFFAVWSKEYSIKYVSGSDEYTVVSKFIAGENHQVLNLPASFAKPEGTGFGGWTLSGTSYDAGDNYTVSSMDVTASEIIFTAVWLTDTFTVSIYHLGADGNYVLLEENTGIEYNETFTLSSTPNMNVVLSGVRYAFIGYGYSSTGEVEIESTNGELEINNVKANISIYAIYNEQYYLTYLDENGDEISKYSFDKNTTFGISGENSFESTSKDGYVLVAWQDGDGKSYKTVREDESGFNYIAGALTLLTLTKDTTLTPVFAKPVNVKIYTTISTTPTGEEGELTTTDEEGNQIYFGGLNTISLIKGDSINIARAYAGTKIHGWILKTSTFVYIPTVNVDYNGNGGSGLDLLVLSNELLAYDTIELIPVVYARVTLTSSREDIYIDDYIDVYAGQHVEIPNEYYNQNYYLDAWEDEDGYVFDFENTRVYTDITLTALFGHFYSLEYLDDDISNKYLLSRNDLKKNDTITLASERNVVGGQNVDYIKQGYTIQGWRLIHNGAYYQESGNDVIFGLGSQFVIDTDKYGSFLGDSNYSFRFEPVWQASLTSITLINYATDIFNVTVNGNVTTEKEFAIYYDMPFTVIGNTLSFNRSDGNEITLVATLKEGAGEFSFTSWTLDGNALSSGDKAKNLSNVELTFTYSAGNVSLTIKTRVDGSISSDRTKGYFQEFNAGAYGDAKHSVVVGGDAGSLGATVKATAGDNITFEGWYTATDANGSGLTLYSKNAEITLSGLVKNTYVFAVFKTSTYQVRFYGYGVYSGNVATQEAFYAMPIGNGLTITEAQLASTGIPTTEGYVFNGWDYLGQPITTDTNIYSNWRKYYTVNIVEDDNTTNIQEVLWHKSGENGNVEVELNGKDTTIALPTLTKTGYDFVNWNVTWTGNSKTMSAVSTTTIYDIVGTYEDGTNLEITFEPVWQAVETTIKLVNPNTTLFSLTANGESVTEQEYNVYYDTTISVSGTTISFETCEGDLIEVVAEKIKVGDYDFETWKLDENTISVDTVISSTSQVTLSFDYESGNEISLVVKVRADGADVSNTNNGYFQVDGASTQQYSTTLKAAIGELGAILKATAGNNYEFLGWYQATSASGDDIQVYSYDATITLSELTENTYVFAMFKTSTYKVHFYGYGVSSSNVSTSTPFKTISVSNGQPITETQLTSVGTPTTSNTYVFESWEYDDQAITSETRIYSNWRKYYTIYIDETAGTTTQTVLWHREGESGTQTVGGKTTNITLPTLTKTGYDFVEWSVIWDGGIFNFSPVSSTTIYDVLGGYEDGTDVEIIFKPVWQAKDVTITIENANSDLFNLSVSEQEFAVKYDEEFTISGNTISFKTSSGDTVTIVATLKSGVGEYSFTSWTLDGNTLSNGDKLNSTTSLTLTFTYSAGSITLTVKTRVDGSIGTDIIKGYFNVDGGSAKYNYSKGGDAGSLGATIEASAGTNYNFEGWYQGSDAVGANLTLYSKNALITLSGLTSNTYLFACFTIKQTSFTFVANNQADVTILNNFDLLKLESITGSLDSGANEYTIYDGTTNNINKDLTIKVNRGNNLSFSVKYKSNSYFIDKMQVVGNSTETLTPTISTSGQYTIATFTYNFNSYEARTLKLLFKLSNLTVNFYGEDQSIPVDSISVPYGYKLTAQDLADITIPTHSENYVFESWQYDGSPITEDNTSIGSTWRRYSVVTFNYDGNSSTQNVLWHRSGESGEITLGGLTTTITIPNATKDGYYFYWNVEWIKEGTATGGSKTIDSTISSTTIYNMVGDYTSNSSVTMTFTAVYSKIYTLEFRSNGEVVSTKIVNAGESFVTPAAPEKVGHTFIGWLSGPSQFDANKTIILDSALEENASDGIIVFDAVFNVNWYSFRFTSSDLDKGGVYDYTEEVEGETTTTYYHRVYCPAPDCSENGETYRGMLDSETDTCWGIRKETNPSNPNDYSYVDPCGTVLTCAGCGDPYNNEPCTAVESTSQGYTRVVYKNDSNLYSIEYGSTITITTNSDNTSYTISFSGKNSSDIITKTYTITLETANYYLAGLLDENNGNGIVSSSFILDETWLNNRADESATNEYSLQFSGEQQVNVSASTKAKNVSGTDYETNTDCATLSYSGSVSKGSTAIFTVNINSNFSLHHIEYKVGGTTKTVDVLDNTNPYTFSCVAEADVEVTFYFTRNTNKLKAVAVLSEAVADAVEVTPFASVDGNGLSTTSEIQINTGIYESTYDFTITPNDEAYIIKVYYSLDGGNTKQAFTSAGSMHFNSQTNKYHITYNGDVLIVVEVDYKPITIVFKDYSGNVVNTLTQTSKKYNDGYYVSDLPALMEDYNIGGNSVMLMKHIGWNYGGTTYYPSSSTLHITNLTSDIVFTSVWEKLYTIEFEYEDGTNIATTKYSNIADIETPSVRTYSGRTFEGWQAIINGKYIYLLADGQTLRYENENITLSTISVYSILTACEEAGILDSTSNASDFVLTFTTVYSIVMNFVADSEEWSWFGVLGERVGNSAEFATSGYSNYFYDVENTGKAESIKVRYGSRIISGEISNTTEYDLRIEDPDGKVHFSIGFFSSAIIAEIADFDKVTLNGEELTSSGTTPTASFTIGFHQKTQAKRIDISLPYDAHKDAYFNVILDLSGLKFGESSVPQSTTYIMLGGNQRVVATGSNVSLATYFSTGTGKYSYWLTYDQLKDATISIACNMDSVIKAEIIVTYDGAMNDTGESEEVIVLENNTLEIASGVIGGTLTYEVASVEVTYNVVIPNAVAGGNYTITYTHKTFDNSVSGGIKTVSTTTNTLTSNNSGKFTVYKDSCFIMDDGYGGALTFTVNSSQYFVSYGVVGSGDVSQDNISLYYGPGNDISDSTWTVTLLTYTYTFQITNGANTKTKTLGTFPISRSTTYADLATYMNNNFNFNDVNNTLAKDSDFNDVMFVGTFDMSALSGNIWNNQTSETNIVWEGSSTAINPSGNRTFSAYTTSVNVYAISVMIKNPNDNSYSSYSASSYASQYRSGLGLRYVINNNFTSVLSTSNDISNNYFVWIRFKASSINNITVTPYNNDYFEYFSVSGGSYYYRLKTTDITVEFGYYNEGTWTVLDVLGSENVNVSALTEIQSVIDSLKTDNDNVYMEEISQPYYYKVSNTLHTSEEGACTGTFGAYLSSNTEFRLVYTPIRKHKLEVQNEAGDSVYTAYYVENTTPDNEETRTEWNTIDFLSLWDNLNGTSGEVLIEESISASKGETGSEFAHFEGSDGNMYCMRIDMESIPHEYWTKFGATCPIITLTDDLTLTEVRIPSYYVYFTCNSNNYKYTSALVGDTLAYSDIVNGFWTATGYKSSNYTINSIKVNGTKFTSGTYTVTGETQFVFDITMKEYTVSYYVGNTLVREVTENGGSHYVNASIPSTHQYYQYYDLLCWYYGNLDGVGESTQKIQTINNGTTSSIFGGDTELHAMLKPKTSSSFYAMDEWTESGNYYYKVTECSAETISYGGQSTLVLSRFVNNVSDVLQGNTKLSHVKQMGSTAKTLAEGAFEGCTSLLSCNITFILGGESVFEGCTSLSEVEINGSTIPNRTFYGCTSLTDVYSSKITSIGDEAFRNCSKLDYISFSSAKTVGTRAFQNCTVLTSFTSGAVTTINNYAFYGCAKLKTFNADTVTTIGNYAFKDCSALTSFPFSTVTDVGTGAFRCSGLSGTISLPKLTTINQESFSLCESLQFVELGSVENIGSYAFQSCSSLEKVTFESITGIIGFSAFNACTQLYQLGNDAGFIKLTGVTTIGEAAFESCRFADLSLENIVYISDGAFKSCSAINNAAIYMGSNDTGTYGEIRESAFENCTSLKSVICTGVLSIGRNAFSNCSNLAKFGASSNPSVTSFNDYTSGSYQGGVVTISSSSAFCDLNSLGITYNSVGNGAFNGCAFDYIIHPEITTGNVGSKFSGCGDVWLVYVDGAGVLVEGV